MGNGIILLSRLLSVKKELRPGETRATPMQMGEPAQAEFARAAGLNPKPPSPKLFAIRVNFM